MTSHWPDWVKIGCQPLGYQPPCDWLHVQLKGCVWVMKNWPGGTVVLDVFTPSDSDSGDAVARVEIATYGKRYMLFRRLGDLSSVVNA